MGSFRPLLSHSMAARLLVFTVVARLLVLKATLEHGNGREQGKLKYYKLSVLTEILLLFLNKSSQNCLYLISRVLKKLILTIFVSVLVASMGNADFLRFFFPRVMPEVLGYHLVF